MCRIALTRWMMPFCRVMRPTNSTNGTSGANAVRASTPGSGRGRYCSRSMPLWMTRTRCGIDVDRALDVAPSSPPTPRRRHRRSGRRSARASSTRCRRCRAAPPSMAGAARASASSAPAARPAGTSPGSRRSASTRCGSGRCRGRSAMPLITRSWMQRVEQPAVARVLGGMLRRRLHAVNDQVGARSAWSPKHSTRTKCRPSSSAASSRVRYSTWTPAPP